MFSRLSGEGIKVVSRSAKCLSVVNREYSGTGGSRYSGTGGSRYKAWTPAGSIVAIASSCALGYFAVDFLQPRIAYAEAPLTEKDLTPPERKDLPVFKKEDVKKHGRNSESIWVTYKGVSVGFFVLFYFVVDVRRQQNLVF
ncbi:hypothetical protein GCK32_014889 [Trichostrongylus colubriformis]|uniref:Uncharacterized protein n=1 Tax=Trichostrongylus colubriformis TaxID=6319 RepID=A0AAN8F1F0_TRICO